MRVAISQPRYLPALNYLQRILLVDKFVLLDTVQYTPRDWENRNLIRNWNGSQWLSVPISGHTRGRLLRDTTIDSSSSWQRQHCQALVHGYRKAPFFSFMQDFLERTYMTSQWDRLCDLNFFIIQEFLELLDKRCDFVWASEAGEDGKGSELILNLCRRVGATTYVSGALGGDYLIPSQFESAGIELLFHDYDPQPYPQTHGEPFVPWLSAVDLFMNNGPGSLGILMRGANLLKPQDHKQVRSE